MFANDAVSATRKEKELLIKTLRKINPTVVGLSVGCSGLAKTAETITHEIHNEINVPVIWGGAHAIVVPEESIKVADFVRAGEGEDLLHNLLIILNNSQQAVSTLPNL